MSAAGGAIDNVGAAGRLTVIDSPPIVPEPFAVAASENVPVPATVPPLKADPSVAIRFPDAAPPVIVDA